MTVIAHRTTEITSDTQIFYAVTGKRAYDTRPNAEQAAKAGVPRIVAYKYVGDTLSAKYPSVTFTASNNIWLDYAHACRQLLYPMQTHTLIAVTGSKGKSSIAFILHILLQDALYIGSLGVYLNGVQVETIDLTTPISYVFYTILSKYPAKYCVFEYSSIGLDCYRVVSDLALAVYTNFVPDDHLNYHGTIENYLACKQLLRARQYLYASRWADDVSGHASPEAGKDLIQVNHQLAFSACKLLQVAVNTDVIIQVPGRLEEIGRINNNPVIVDYAHTGFSLESVCKMYQHWKIILIFGVGGGKDIQRRYHMGAVAKQYAYKTILTTDNPRWDDPLHIITEINHPEAEIILDRTTAIEHGILYAQKLQNCCVLIVGKGRENYQQIKGVNYPHSDIEIATAILNRLH